MEWDSESVKSEDVFKQPANPDGEMKAAPSTPQSNGGVRIHEFVSKTVRMTLVQKKSTGWMWLEKYIFLDQRRILFMSKLNAFSTGFSII